MEDVGQREDSSPLATTVTGNHGTMKGAEHVKENLLTLLTSQGVQQGIALDKLPGLYQEHFQEPLDYKALGFSFLMEFFQAMPQTFILKYQRREESWKVYANLKRTLFKPPFSHNLPCMNVLPEKDQQQINETLRALETESTCSTDVDQEAECLDVNQLSLVPDSKGVYSVCFPSDRKPENWTDLMEVFSVAGPVVEIHKTAKMVFVRYSSPDMVRLALKMYPFLGLTVARVNIEASPKEWCEWRTQASTRKSGVEVLINNLHNHYTMTKVHLQDLFSDYRLQDVDIRHDADRRTQYARVTLATVAEAQRLVSQFDGHNFLGRNLVITIGQVLTPLPQTGNRPGHTQTSTTRPLNLSPDGLKMDLARPAPTTLAADQRLHVDNHSYLESAYQGQVSKREVIEDGEESLGASAYREVFLKEESPSDRDLTCISKLHLGQTLDPGAARGEDTYLENSYLKHEFCSRTSNGREDCSFLEPVHFGQVSDVERPCGDEQCSVENWNYQQLANKRSEQREEECCMEKSHIQNLLNNNASQTRRGGYLGNSLMQYISPVKVETCTSLENRFLTQAHIGETLGGKGQSSFLENSPPEQAPGLMTAPRGPENLCATVHEHTTDQDATLRRHVFVQENNSQLKKEIPIKREACSDVKNVLLGEAANRLKSNGSHCYTDLKAMDHRCDQNIFQEGERTYSENGRQGQIIDEETTQGQGACDSEESVPQMSPLEVWVKQTGVEVPCIFVTNFRKGTIEKDLSRWFAQYNPISVCIVKCANSGLVKAHIELQDKEMVRRAVYEMSQQKILGMKIKVDVPYFLPKLRAEVLGTNPISLRRMKNPKLSQFIGDRGMLQELALERRKVVESLQTPELPLPSGGQLEVVVMHIINDSLFMGQAVCGDVAQRLSEISEEISAAAESRLPLTRMAHQVLHGPCLAKWRKDYKWHRAWFLHGQVDAQTAAVYLLDVGVMDQVAWSCIRCYNNPEVWGLSPAALPFNLTEPIVRLKDRLYSKIVVSVTVTDMDGIISARPLSLVSNWKDMLNVDTVLC